MRAPFVFKLIALLNGGRIRTDLHFKENVYEY